MNEIVMGYDGSLEKKDLSSFKSLKIVKIVLSK
jgi:hypothetical protein